MKQIRDIDMFLKYAFCFGVALFGTVFLISGCGKGGQDQGVHSIDVLFDENISEISIRPIEYIDSFGDSIYVDDIFGISYSRDYGLFMTMLQQKIVLHLSKSLDLVDVIGKPGEGPGEFETPSFLVVNDDSLYISDNDGMEVYTVGGDYVRSVKGLRTPRKFDVYGKFVYMNTLHENYPISKVNLKGEVVAGFGEWRHKERPNYRALNTRFIQATDEGDIIAVLAVEPVVERYTKDGELVQTLDLSHLETLKRLYENVNEKNDEYEKKGMFRNINVVFGDVYLQKGKNRLYLLCAGWPDKGIGTYLLVVDLAHSKMKPVGLLRLYGIEGSGKSVLRRLGVSDGDRIVTVDSYSGGILIYDLSGEFSNL